MTCDSTLIILGIDPGTLITGFGLIALEGSHYRPLDYGCIRPPAKYKLSDRYLIIFNAVEQLIERYRPNVVVIETQYVNKNVQSAIKLGMVRGIVTIAAKKRNIPIYEFTPTKTKLAVVGTGKASKIQVQSMIQKLLNLSSLPTPEDAADALALAICYANCATHLRANHEL